MSIEELLKIIKDRDIRLEVSGSELLIDGSKQALTEDVLAALKRHKTSLIRSLRSLVKEEKGFRRYRLENGKWVDITEEEFGSVLEVAKFLLKLGSHRSTQPDISRT